MFRKIFAGFVLASFIFVAGAAEAYDLPKIKSERKHTKKFSRTLSDKKTLNAKKKSFGKSDWKSAELFETKIKKILESGEKISPSSALRIAEDDNYIFVAFYKDQAYFLDKRSLRIKKDADGVQSWQQFIFPIGPKVLPINAKSTKQKFCFDGKNIYNSFSQKNNLTGVENDEEKIFLEECFEVGYFYTFGKEIKN